MTPKQPDAPGLQYTFVAGDTKPFKCGSCDYSTNGISRLRRHQNGTVNFFFFIFIVSIIPNII